MMDLGNLTILLRSKRRYGETLDSMYYTLRVGELASWACGGRIVGAHQLGLYTHLDGNGTAIFDTVLDTTRFHLTGQIKYTT